MKRKILPILSAVFLSSFCLSMSGTAAETYYTHDISNGDVVLTREQCGEHCPGHIVSGKSNTSPPNIIYVESGNHNVTIEDLTIDASQSDGKCAFAINPKEQCTVNMTLKGNNVLKSGDGRAGIQVTGESSLNIDEDFKGVLDVHAGAGGAGIGGEGNYGTSGNITINSGTINAFGSTNGAGIGGSNEGGAGSITINGGTVTAKGGSNSKNGTPGIGCGSAGKGGGILTINGGQVSAEGGTGKKDEAGVVAKAAGIDCATLSSKEGAILVMKGDIAAKTDVKSFHGVVWFDSKNCKVYGDARIDEKFKLAAGQTMNIRDGSSLTIPNNWNCDGVINGTGSIVNMDKMGVLGEKGEIAPTIKRKVIMIATDVKTQDEKYTGKDLTDTVVKIAPERVVGGVIYAVDTNGWKRSIQKGGTETVKQIQDVGSYKVTYSHPVHGEITKNVSVKQREIEYAKVTLSGRTIFTGEEIRPAISVTYEGMKMEEGVDYEVPIYENNVNVGDKTARILIKAKGNFSGVKTENFTISPASIESAAVSVSLENTLYDGTKKNPKVTAKLSDRVLQPETDYTILYSDPKLTDAGKITVNIQGKGNYTGKASAEFEIQKVEIPIIDATAIDKVYDGNTKVKIKTVNLDLSGVVAADQGKVREDATDLFGTVDDAKVGSYDKVVLEEVKLTGGKEKNYKVVMPEDGIVKLTENVNITKGLPPEAPKIKANYDVSVKAVNKFVCTVDVEKPIADADYEYSMDSVDKWQNDNVFDGIEPNSEHIFYVRTKETIDVQPGKVGNVKIVFQKLKKEAPEQFTLEFIPNEDDTFTAVIPEVTGAVYSFDGVNFVEGDNRKSNCTPNTEYTGYVKFLEDATHSESAVTTDTQTTPKLTVATPVISPEDGKFINTQEVTMSCETEGAEIFYTLDGKTPTKDSEKYIEPFKVDKSLTVKAIAFKDNMDESAMAAATYTKAGSSAIKTRVTAINGIPEVPAGLQSTIYNSVEAITTQMTRTLTSIDGYTYLNIAFYDISLKLSLDGANWIPATIENFPEEGLSVVMPYPENTGKDTHDFVVSHMFAESSERLGIAAGDTEEPKVTKTNEGLKFTVKSTSPVAIAWKSTNSGGGNGNNGGNNGNTPDDGNNNPDDGNNTGDVNNPNNGNNGNNPDNGNNTGDGNNIGDVNNPTDGDNGADGGQDGIADGTNLDGTGDGTGQDGDGSGGQNKAADGTGQNGEDGANNKLGGLFSPKTGDSAKIALWGGIIVIGAAVIIVLIKKKRR